MNKNFIIILLFFGLCLKTNAQNKLYLTPLKYTATGFTSFNQVCYQPNGIEYYLNGVKWVEGVDYTQGFCAYGICQITFPFGSFKVGDSFEVRDNCGSISASRIIEDDYVYVEVPGGNSYASNGIGPNDETPPYTRLANKILVGKCEPVNLNSHGLHNMGIFVGTVNTGPSYTSGIFLINGIPIKLSDFNIDTFGNPNAVSYNINTNGSVTYNSNVGLNTKINYSGRTLFEFEYRHNGVLPFDVQEFTLGALGLRIWSNTRITVKDHAYTGTTETEISGNYTNSIFKFTYDGANFKLFNDGVLIKTIPRSVIYSSSSGTISNTNLLPYGNGVSWTPTNSGNQWVRVVVDGVLVTRQEFSVVDDMVINETITNVGCFGGSNGGISVSVNGGKSPLQYAINTGAYGSATSFLNLSAGTYTIKVKDASGCVVSKLVTIGENLALSLSTTTKTNANCNNDPSGSITLSGSGGIGVLQYSKDNVNFQNSNTFSGLTAGNYTFWVKDVAGCTKSLVESIGQNSSLTGSAAATQNVSCFGGNDGIITITTTGTPSGPITYSIDNINFTGNNVFSNLSQGSYPISVKDNLCTVAIGNQAISQPTELAVNALVNKNVSCFGGNDGQITVSANGGAGPFQYSKDGVTYQNSNIFTDLIANSYKFWIKDSKNCIKETTIFTTSQPTILKLIIAGKLDVKCNGGNDGSVSLTAGGGTPNYQFSKDGINFQTSNIFNGLSSGTYTFTVKDNLNCTKTIQTTITQPNVFEFSTKNSNNLTCFENNTGQISVTGQGGTLPYQFSVDNITFQNNGNFANLGAGNYTVFGKDVNNCQIKSSFSLSQPTNIAVSIIEKLDVNCEESTKGYFKLLASGGTGNITYNLSGNSFTGNILPIESNSTGLFENLKIGNYTVIVQDQNACTKNFPATIISKNSPIRFEISKKLPTNCLMSDGIISVNSPVGGQGTYIFRISSQPNGSTDNVFNNLTNGNYLVTVSDDFCDYTQAVDLSLPNSIKASYTISPQNCQSPNANLNIDNITGGNGNYSLAIDGQTFTGNRNYPNLKPNTYAITIQDSPLSCKSVVSLQIKEQNRADLKVASFKNISCFEGKDGSITALGDNNVGPFQYAINNGSFNNNSTFGNLTVGTYKITALNAIGCLDSLKFKLTQPTLLEAITSQKNNLCFDDLKGEIVATAKGGTLPYQYSINDIDYQNENIFEKLGAKVYNFSVKDKNNCLFNKKIEISQPDLLVLTPINQDLIRCFGEANGSILVNTSGGTPGFVYSLDNKIYENTNLFQNLKKGKYQIFVKDANQCQKQSEIELKEPDLLTLTTIKQADPLCAGEQNGIIEVKAAGGNVGYEFIRDNSEKNASGLFEKLTQAEYTFKVLDSKKCEANIEKVELKWPKPLSAVIEKVTTPKCFGDVNGAAQLTMEGGISPYSGQLLTDKTTANPLINNAISFENLASGKYSVKLADINGCELTIPINIPAAEKLAAIDFTNLPKEVCKGQEVVLTVNNPNQKLEWYLDGILLPTASTTDFKFSKDLQELSTTKTGKYTVIAKNISGCEVKGEYTLINNKNALKADFLIPTQAFVGDTVVCLDITKPVPDKILWKIPTESYDFQATKSTISLVFVNKSADKFTVEMKAFLGECVNIVKHEIKIFDRKDVDLTDKNLGYQDKDIIENVEIFPNPNNGKFVVKVKLTRSAPISIQINRQTTGENVFSKNDLGKDIYIFDVELNVFSGLYLLTIKSERSTKISRIYISK